MIMQNSLGYLKKTTVGSKLSFWHMEYIKFYLLRWLQLLLRFVGKTLKFFHRSSFKIDFRLCFIPSDKNYQVHRDPIGQSHFKNTGKERKFRLGLLFPKARIFTISTILLRWTGELWGLVKKIGGLLIASRTVFRSCKCSVCKTHIIGFNSSTNRGVV